VLTVYLKNWKRKKEVNCFHGKEKRMKVTKLDHIGIAVKNMDEALAFYRETLGIDSVGTEVIEEQKVKVAFLPLGDTELELLESTAPDGPVAKFIEKRGEGIQHIALRVESIEEALAELKEKGFKLIDQEPRYGAGNAQIAFLHPKATGGILLELSERE
jgi:methylmalonyl-CoA epimerase